MRKSRCLFCYEPLTVAGSDFHEHCSKIFFGTKIPPVLPYNLDDMSELAKKVIRSHVTIPGVQSKISIGLRKYLRNQPGRFTIVGLWGSYILKPPSTDYPYLPETESITMKLAALFNLKTVPNSLIRLKSGEPAYITKRIDRVSGNKLPMEDMAQLTGKLTEDKYRGSMEQIGKAIARFSSNPGFDLLNFFEITLFSFITGNADMHLKNFSIFYKNNMYMLAPAYDLLATRLLIPESRDKEELALTLNGKKNRFGKKDFVIFARNLGIPEKALAHVFTKFQRTIPLTESLILKSFIPKAKQQELTDLIINRWARINPNFS